ncbi:MAG: hypothetical protein AMS26_09095 [Bacteroides sp. SM23_62]|nr:MAG: hypothetical protein AMS26_09095 [Bacteroides sp. SM23_62]
MKTKQLATLLLFFFSTMQGKAQPISLHPENPHYFEYKGNPVILITSGEHYGAVINRDLDYEIYLHTLAEDGLNLTRIFCGTYVEHPGSFGIKHNTLAPPAESFLAPWKRTDVVGNRGGGTKFDLDRWDPEYFERLKGFVTEAGKHDIIVEVTLFSSIYNDKSWTYCPLYHENNINQTDQIERVNVHTPHNGNLIRYQEKFVQKLVTELKDFDNIYYEIQNEPWADNSDEFFALNPNDSATHLYWRRKADLPNAAADAWQERIGEIIAETESTFDHRHLIAQNYGNFMYPIKEVEDHVSIINFHYALPQAVEYNYGYDLPIGFDEDGFCGPGDRRYRENAWNFIVAGGGIYNNLDYSFFVGYENGTLINDAPGYGSAALREQLSFLKSYMEGFDFIRLKPSRHLVRLAPGTVPQVLANEGKEYAVYLHGGSQCNLQLYLPPGKYEATWLNPVSCGTEKSEVFDHEGEVKTLSSPEYDGDIALKIVRADGK